MSNIPNTRETSLSPVRSRLIVTIIGLGWLILSARLIQLQGLQRDKFAGKAEQQREYLEETTARPGDIVDRQGRLLATTLSTRSLYLVPVKIANARVVSEVLAAPLGLSAENLTEKITANSHRQFLWVKRRLTEAEIKAIRQLTLPKGAWGFRDEFRREYPQGVVAAQVIGLRDIDGVGRGGIEERFDSTLRGQNGKRHVARDSRGHVIEILDKDQQLPVPGQNVRLTLDVVVQLYA